MDHYFVGRTKNDLSEVVASNKVEYAYFVDEQIDEKRTLDHLVITNSTFSNIGFKRSNISLCDFSFCVFINCYFKRAQLHQIKFQSCEFINCNFEGATFIGCDFQYAEFDGCFIPFSAMEDNLPHEKENLNGALCRALSIQCLKLGAVEDYKHYLFEERKAGEIHAIRKLFHPSGSYYSKYSFFDGIEGLLYYLRSKASKFLWGYGEKMGVLVRNIILVILGYAAAYMFNIQNMLQGKSKYDCFAAVYLSACTFFSASIDLLQQSSLWQLLLLSEHILGAILVGFFGAALFRQINRR